MGFTAFQATQATQTTQSTQSTPNDPNDSNAPNKKKATPLVTKIDFRQAVARLAKIPKAGAYSAYVTVLGIKRNAANAA